jgi:putative peptidoglycan lipid II flippase
MKSAQEDTFSQIGKASGIIILLTLVDKILAVVKEMSIASRFGVSAALDAFNIAYALPGITLLLFSGAFIAAFVPLYIEWSQRIPEAEANGRAMSLFYCGVILFGGLTVAGYFLSPIIFPLMGHGFAPQEMTLGVELERWLVFLLLLDGTGIIFCGLLHAKKQFASLYTAPLFINLAIIGFLWFQGQMGIYALVWGSLLGMLGKLLYVAVSLWGGGFPLLTRPLFDRAGMVMFFGLVFPLVGSELIANSNILVDQVMATQLSSGSVSTLRYAYRLNDMPIQLVILAFSKAIFPYISERVLAGDYEGLRDIYRRSLVFLALITLPIMALVILFSEEVVSLLLQRGAFDAQATRQTAETLRCYSYGLCFYGYTFVNGVFFSALKQTSVLFYMGCVSILLNFTFNFVFMEFMGVKGIALSTTVTLAVLSAGFVLLLKKRLQVPNLSVLFKNLWGIAVGAVVMFGVGFFCKMAGAALALQPGVIFPVGAALAGGVYLLSLWSFGGGEWRSCVAMFVPLWRPR